MVGAASVRVDAFEYNGRLDRIEVDGISRLESYPVRRMRQVLRAIDFDSKRDVVPFKLAREHMTLQRVGRRARLAECEVLRTKRKEDASGYFTVDQETAQRCGRGLALGV